MDFYKEIINNILNDGKEITGKTLKEYFNKIDEGCTQAIVMDYDITNGMYLIDENEYEYALHGRTPEAKVIFNKKEYFIIDDTLYAILYAGGNYDQYGITIAICRNLSKGVLRILK